jgi:large subunit ribosomal protein L23
MKTMTLKSRVSEKTYGLSQMHNTYVFEVPKDANKLTVAQAVAAQFKVTVEDVNISNLKGKAKRTVRKGGRPVAGRDVDVKKAFVTLKAGDSLPIFANDDDKADEKPAKKEKK